MSMKRYIVLLSLFIAGCSADIPPVTKTYVHLYDRQGIYKTYIAEDLRIIHGLVEFKDIETGRYFQLMGNISVDHTP